MSHNRSMGKLLVMMAAFATVAVAQECNGSGCNTDEISVFRLQVNLQQLSSDAKQQRAKPCQFGP